VSARRASRSPKRPRRASEATPLEREARKAVAEHGRAIFRLACVKRDIFAPASEHVFAPGRKFAFDYAWIADRVALEVEGGVFTRQAHGSISGMLRDMSKYNLAASLGWRVLRVLPRELFAKSTFDLISKTLGVA